MVGNKTLIAVTTGEYARRADFYDYHTLLIKPPNSYVILNHDRSPARGRNICIDIAQQHCCTHILLVDDDHQFEPDALIRLIEHDKDIVSGLYYSRSYPHIPMVFDVADDEGACFPIYLTNGKEGLIPIVASGFGFCLIKMTVFDKLEKPYVRLGELNSEEWCDDMGFFKRVREAGIKDIWCDLEVKVGHMGTVIIKPERISDGTWVTTYDTGGSGSIRTPQIAPEVAYDFRKE